MDEPVLQKEAEEEPIEEVKWQAPSESRGAKGVWNDRLQVLIPKPGRWAIVHHYNGARGAEFSAGNLRRQARNGKLSPGIWEFTSRVNHDIGGSDLYARWMGIVGEPSHDEAQEVERQYQLEQRRLRSQAAGG